MNALDRKLITLLQENARYDISALAAMTGEDADAVAASMARLEESGAIVKYSAIINDSVLDGESVEALIEVKVVPQKLKGFDAFAEELNKFREVKNLYLMSGGFDLAVFVTGRNIGEISKFVSENLGVIDGVVSVQTHFLLKKYKIEGQVCEKDTIDRQYIG